MSEPHKVIAGTCDGDPNCPYRQRGCGCPPKPCRGCIEHGWRGLWDVQRRRLLHERVTFYPEGKYQVIACTNPETMTMPDHLYPEKKNP